MSFVFRVWAPKPEAVEIEVDGRRHAMERAAGGWWMYRHDSASDGTRYAYFVDGEGPFPDPRSARQPEGPHAASARVDHGQFPWKQENFQAPPLDSAIIYELHIGTFTPAGTFDAAIEKLGSLRDLGITHVELMPVNTFSGERGWGYDGVTLFAPFEPYGGPDGLKRFVDACHREGLAVILDVVYNHFGPEGNYLGKFAPYLTGNYHTVWGEAVNLDGEDSDEVRRFFIDNALMWLRDYRIDALRLDAVHAFFDRSARHLLEEMAEEVETLGRQLGKRFGLIAESDLNDPRIVQARQLGGHGMDAQWSDDFHHCLHTIMTGEKRGYYADFGLLSHLAKSLEQAFVYDGIHSPDRRRRHGRRPEGIPAGRFLGYIQNHDQVGNRAMGERLSHLVSPEKARIAAALVLAGPFVPMIFMGEEWGASSPFQYFTDHQDPDLGEAVRKGRREEFRDFGWKPEDVPDPQAAETFHRSKLNWEEREEEPHASFLTWYRRLITLRKERGDLRAPSFGNLTVIFDEEAGWLALRRGSHQILVNFSGNRAEIPLVPGLPAETLLVSGDIRIEHNTAFAGGHSVAILGSRN